MLAEARDNVAFGTPDEWAGLAEPDGVEPAPVELWREALAGFATERQDRAGHGARAPHRSAADQRVRVEDADYADVLGESAVATTTGIAALGRETGCYVSVSTHGRRRRRDPDRLRLLRRPRRRPTSTWPRRRGDGADRATRLLGATKPTSRKVTVVLDPFVTAQFLGVRRPR